jgi:hypothetical protein
VARWKLLQPPYLNVEGVEWEYQETQNGRGRRQRFAVPLLLNPKDPDDVALYGVNGSIVVSDGNGAQEGDIVFRGDPTPDMDPLDDEAREISARFEAKWRFKPDGMEGGFSASILAGLQEQIDTLSARAPAAPPSADIEALKAQNALLVEKLALLEARLDEATASAVRRL